MAGSIRIASNVNPLFYLTASMRNRRRGYGAGLRMMGRTKRAARRDIVHFWMIFTYLELSVLRRAEILSIPTDNVLRRTNDARFFPGMCTF
jgi:hypothetical protein